MTCPTSDIILVDITEWTGLIRAFTILQWATTSHAGLGEITLFDNLCPQKRAKLIIQPALVNKATEQVDLSVF